MQDHVYKIIELVGSSETSIEDAVQSAIARAAQTSTARGDMCDLPRTTNLVVILLRC